MLRYLKVVEIFRKFLRQGVKRLVNNCPSETGGIRPTRLPKTTQFFCFGCLTVMGLYPAGHIPAEPKNWIIDLFASLIAHNTH
jgi:hypothetical protein